MMTSIAARHFNQHIRLAEQVRDTLATSIADAAERLVTALRSGHKILLCGNGGSAADAQHIAAELVGRYEVAGRRALPALALTTDSSALTAIANDLSFDQVFARQVGALGQPGDVMIAISTSGNSPNVVAAVERARDRQIETIGLLGRQGGSLAAVVDLAIVIPGETTALIQEMHITIGHILCAAVDAAFLEESAANLR